MAPFPVIPAKLLLFGEHSVLLGMPAITLPLWDFTSRLKLAGNEKLAMQSGFFLKKFAEYLQQQRGLNKVIDLERMVHLIDNEGLYLDSEVPAGYGLGSSAGVCVAVYKAFYTGAFMETSPLKEFYGRMESYFHGISSGMDPLVIHTEKPLLVKNSGVEFLKENIRLPEGMHLYLLNSGIPRNAINMVNAFRELYELAEYKSTFHRYYEPALHRIINSVADGEGLSNGMLRELSHQQLHFFRRMIPDGLVPLWQQHLSDETAYFKILGAGGGGFFLVFSRNEYKEMGGYSMISINLKHRPEAGENKSGATLC